MLDEITINGIKYRKVEEEKEAERPVNFNPFEIPEKSEIWLLPNGIVGAGSTAWYYTNKERKKELVDDALVVNDEQVGLSLDFRCNIMRKLLKYGYEHNCLWNGKGKAYTVGYTTIGSDGIQFMPITWTDTSDVCTIAFNSLDECNDAINCVVRVEYIKAQKENKKLYKKGEWE